MLFLGKGNLQAEDNEPVLRSCWICNPAHEHLKKVNLLHCCNSCYRMWVFDKFTDEFKNDADIEKFFTELGLSVGDSTSKIDAGYRIHTVTMKPKPKGA